MYVGFSMKTADKYDVFKPLLYNIFYIISFINYENFYPSQIT